MCQDSLAENGSTSPEKQWTSHSKNGQQTRYNKARRARLMTGAGSVPKNSGPRIRLKQIKADLRGATQRHGERAGLLGLVSRRKQRTSYSLKTEAGSL
jgi:hypothetical protein